MHLYKVIIVRKHFSIGKIIGIICTTIIAAKGEKGLEIYINNVSLLHWK